MNNIHNKVRRILALLITFIVVLIRIPLIKYYRKRNNIIKLNKLRRNTFINIYKSLGGINFEIITNNSIIDTSKPYILCANHSSYLDIGSIILAAHKLGLKKTFFILKKELSKQFLFKHYVLSLDIPIDRDSKLDAIRAFKKSSEKFKLGESLIIFPEGTISKTYPPKIQKFQPGAFSIAIKSQTPIIPITIIDAWKIIHNTGSVKGLSKGTIKIIIHETIQTNEFTPDSLDELMNKVHKVISDTYYAMSTDFKA